MINAINTVECRITCIYLALKDMEMLASVVGIFCISLLPYATHPPTDKWIIDKDGKYLSYEDIYERNNDVFKTMAKELCGMNNL